MSDYINKTVKREFSAWHNVQYAETSLKWHRLLVVLVQRVVISFSMMQFMFSCFWLWHVYTLYSSVIVKCSLLRLNTDHLVLTTEQFYWAIQPTSYPDICKSLCFSLIPNKKRKAVTCYMMIYISSAISMDFIHVDIWQQFPGEWSPTRNKCTRHVMTGHDLPPEFLYNKTHFKGIRSAMCNL